MNSTSSTFLPFSHTSSLSCFVLPPFHADKVDVLPQPFVSYHQMVDSIECTRLHPTTNSFSDDSSYQCVYRYVCHCGHQIVCAPSKLQSQLKPNGNQKRYMLQLSNAIVVCNKYTYSNEHVLFPKKYDRHFGFVVFVLCWRVHDGKWWGGENGKLTPDPVTHLDAFLFTGHRPVLFFFLATIRIVAVAWSNCNCSVPRVIPVLYHEQSFFLKVLVVLCFLIFSCTPLTTPCK